jgi:hypothetical protein
MSFLIRVNIVSVVFEGGFGIEYANLRIGKGVVDLF